MYNCYKHTAPDLLCSLVTRKFPYSNPDDDDFNCDYDDRLYYPNLREGRRAFCFYGPRIWNALPYDIRECSTKDSFKKQLKTYLWNHFDELMYNFNRYRNM